MYIYGKAHKNFSKNFIGYIMHMFEKFRLIITRWVIHQKEMTS